MLVWEEVTLAIYLRGLSTNKIYPVLFVQVNFHCETVDEVNLAPPVGVMNLASTVGVVNLASPVGVA